MELEGYRLEARSPFHIGQPGVGQENIASFMRSDTLFGALCSGILALYGREALEEWLAAFQTDPPCLLSSAFPYYKELRFFPRPELPNLPLNEQTRKYRKVKFVSEKIYRQLLAGNWPGEGETREFHKDDPELKAIISRADDRNLPDCLWTKAPAPHVSVDRVSSRSALYYSGRLFFQPGGGLHFLVRWLDPDHLFRVSGRTARQLLEHSLWYLSDHGIGGNLSSGHGQFVFPESSDKFQFEDDPVSKRYSCLSLYYPTSQEWTAVRTQPGTAYELVLRVGWISAPGLTTLQRRPVWMLAEGAALDFDNPPELSGLGGLADVTPDWSQTPEVSYRPTIYRYGRALAVPLKG